MGNIVIGILAHVDAGKTTLSESLLYLSGAIRKQGRVDNGDAFLDTYDLEKKRGITIFSKQARMEFSGKQITLLDTPGHADFSAEMERTLQVLDYAILVISGADGVQGHTRTLWRLLKRYDIPTFVFINKMDQPGTEPAALMEDVKKSLDDDCVDFTAYRYKDSAENTEAFKDLCDRIAMCDEEALNEFLENDILSSKTISELIFSRKLFPCFFGSALRMTGVEEFIDGLSSLIIERKYTDKFGARVYKISRDDQGRRLTFLKITGGILRVKEFIGDEKVNEIRLYSGSRYESADTVCAGQIAAVTGPLKTHAGDGFGCERENMLPLLEPVLTYSIELPSGTDAHKMLEIMHELEEEDPQLHVLWSDNAREIRVQLMGEIQTQVLTQLIHERYGIDVHFGEGKILYKETIEDSVEGVGHFEPLRHYAEVHLRLEPAERGSGLSYASECSANQLDRNWQRLILTHLAEKVHIGVLTGSPVTDMRIVLIAGKAHPKHTEGGDFRQATYRAVRQGLMKARSVILEPFYDFRLEIPGDQIGRAMSDIEKFSGTFTLEENNVENAVLTGRAPVSEMRGYQKEVAAYTGGNGRITVSVAGYFPCHDPARVWEECAYDPESDLDNTPDSVFCSHGAGFVVPWYVTEKYMHLPGAGLPDYSGMTAQDFDWYDDAYAGPIDEGEFEGNRYSEKSARQAKDAVERKRGKILPAAGEDELKAIFERTYGPVKSKLHDTTTVIRAADNKEYIWKEKPNKKEKKGDFLLVDGYNVIFSWPELNSLASHDIAAARDTLMNVLSEYQGYTGKNVILVFDAYKVQGFKGEAGKWHNIDVIFTKEAETADQYIEKTAHVMGKKYNVTVVTSDGTEQVIIRSEGCYLMSSRDFKAEIDSTKKQIREEHLEKYTHSGNYLGEYMPDEIKGKK